MCPKKAPVPSTAKACAPLPSLILPCLNQAIQDEFKVKINGFFNLKKKSTALGLIDGNVVMFFV
jgi:hypothetical protein